MASGSGKPSHVCLRLLQPEPHVHLAVHRRRRGEVLVGLLALAYRAREFPEAELAVGDERAYAEFLCERPAVVRLRGLGVRGTPIMSGDLAEARLPPREVSPHVDGIAVSEASRALGPPLGRFAGHGAHVRGNRDLQDLQVF
jgi:hypothetical protein